MTSTVPALLIPLRGQRLDQVLLIFAVESNLQLGFFSKCVAPLKDSGGYHYSNRRLFIPSKPAKVNRNDFSIDPFPIVP
jgi:hypothetical protein